MKLKDEGRPWAELYGPHTTMLTGALLSSPIKGRSVWVGNLTMSEFHNLIKKQGEIMVEEGFQWFYRELDEASEGGA